jgi:hypothetical protein
MISWLGAVNSVVLWPRPRSYTVPMLAGFTEKGVEMLHAFMHQSTSSTMNLILEATHQDLAMSSDLTTPQSGVAKPKSPDKRGNNANPLILLKAEVSYTELNRSLIPLLLSSSRALVV